MQDSIPQRHVSRFFLLSFGEPAFHLLFFNNSRVSFLTDGFWLSINAVTGSLVEIPQTNIPLFLGMLNVQLINSSCAGNEVFRHFSFVFLTFPQNDLVHSFQWIPEMFPLPTTL